MYSRVPANSAGTGPDESYAHTILKGMTVTSDSGAEYTTVRDAVVSFQQDNYVSSEFSEDGARTTYYVYKTSVPIISGETKTISVDVGNYQKFLKIQIKDSSVTEVINVFDESGNEYYQVENLSQDTIYRKLATEM